MPVPQSAKRSWQLGHHPARELAHAFAMLAGGRSEAILALGAQDPRAAPLPRQAALTQPERLARRFGFALSREADLERLPEHAIVVDDFLTTGSTALAAAWVLHQAGVEKIDFAFLGFRPGRLDPKQPELGPTESTALPERKLQPFAEDLASGSIPVPGVSPPA